MATKFLDKEFYTENRKQFISLLKPSSLVIINTYDTLPRSGDQDFHHKPNPNLLYLTGICQEETLLFLYPDCPNPSYREVLFVSDRNEAMEIWNGKRLSKEEASTISGIKNVQWLSGFDTYLREAMAMTENVYLDYNEYGGYAGFDDYKNLRFVNMIKNSFPIHNYNRTYPLFQQLRLQKKDAEIKVLKEAIEITGKAFSEAARTLKPGINEYEIEAAITYNFLKHDARHHGFSTIVASGINACYLHYHENSAICNNNDLLLIDMGAELDHYTSDISRVLPVNGKFTPRQKQIYNTVLGILKRAEKFLVKGATINSVNAETAKIMEEELIKLGLLNAEDVKKQNPDSPLYKKYYPHGLSHFLGMDAHDIGHKFIPFKPGMVVTCEPGIYIFEEKMGIRLENDILITEGEPINLSAGIPIEIDDIEDLMNIN